MSISETEPLRTTAFNFWWSAKSWNELMSGRLNVNDMYDVKHELYVLTKTKAAAIQATAKSVPGRFPDRRREPYFERQMNV